MILIFVSLFSGTGALASSRSSYVQLEDTALKFESLLRSELASSELTVVFEPHDPKINAELIKTDTHLTIRVWGGMLGHRLMTEDALLLLLCHEIGHYLGGPPTKSKGGWSSTEGQADYYSSFQCARDVGLEEVSFYEAALNLTRIYAMATFSSEPRIESCDQTIVTRTNFGYPSVQCRLDTLIAGWKKLPRPQCWFWQ